MPQRPGSACRRPGCAGIVRNGLCSSCGPLKAQRQAEEDGRRGTAAQRGYGARWQRARMRFLVAHPLCADCLREGRTTAATDVHHKLARRAGGSDDADNLEALCHSCHSKRTAAGE